MTTFRTAPPSIASYEKAPRLVRLMALGGLIFLHFPLLIVLLYAFTTDRQTYLFPPPGLTLEWVQAIFSRPDFWSALLLSLAVASTAVIVSVILGTLASLAMSRSQFFGKNAISLMFILPIALPGIVTGIALRSGIKLLGIDFSFWTIVIGHATFCIVTVYNNVVARLRRSSYSQIEASLDLGASLWQTFRYVTFPTIATALLAGGMLAFALSFDEVIVTTFTSSPQLSPTLPIWIFNQLVRPRDRPVTNVAAIIVIAITVIPIVLAYRYSQETSETT